MDRAINGLVRCTPVEEVIAESLLTPISTRFQAISLLMADEWAHLPTFVVKPSSPHAPDEEKLAQHSIYLFESTQCQSSGFSSNSPLLWAAFHSSMGQASPCHNIHHTSFQENVTIPAERPFASNPCLHSASGLPDLHRWFGLRWNRGRRCRFFFLSQDDLIQEWHAATGTHDSSFQTEKAALRDAIQWLSSI